MELSVRTLVPDEEAAKYAYCPACGKTNIVEGAFANGSYAVKCSSCGSQMSFSPELMAQLGRGGALAVWHASEAMKPPEQPMVGGMDMRCPICGGVVDSKTDEERGTASLVCRECGERYVMKLERYRSMGIPALMKEWRGSL